MNEEHKRKIGEATRRWYKSKAGQEYVRTRPKPPLKDFVKCYARYRINGEVIRCNNLRPRDEKKCYECQRRERQYIKHPRLKYYPYMFNGKEICYTKNENVICKNIPKDYLWLDLTL